MLAVSTRHLIIGCAAGEHEALDLVGGAELVAHSLECFSFGLAYKRAQHLVPLCRDRGSQLRQPDVTWVDLGGILPIRHGRQP